MLENWIVDQSTARDFTVHIHNIQKFTTLFCVFVETEEAFLEFLFVAQMQSIQNYYLCHYKNQINVLNYEHFFLAVILFF